MRSQQAVHKAARSAIKRVPITDCTSVGTRRPRGALRSLFKHQARGIAHAQRVQHPALFWEMRLGKTLTAIRRVKQYGAHQRVLVVAPYSALYAWARELELENECSVTMLTGAREERKQKLPSDRKPRGREWYLLNKEGHLVVPEVALVRWDVVVLDESRFIANPQSKVSKFFVNNFRSVAHRWVLTGTPATAGPLDYVQQLNFLDAAILQCDYWRFRKRFMRECMHDYTITAEGRQYLSAALARSAHFLKRSDVKLGGQKLYTQRVVRLADRTRTVYERIMREFALGDKLTIHSTTQFIWARRLCGGMAEGKLIDNAKLAELKALINGELHGQQLIVWCVFREELALLEKYLRCAVIHGDIKPARREEIRQEFERGAQRVVAIQPECMKFGSNWSAASAMVYYSTPFGETRAQTEDRTINLMKTDSALIIDLIAENTIEEGIHEALRAGESEDKFIRRLWRYYAAKAHGDV